jgi:hypothetical protein
MTGLFNYFLRPELLMPRGRAMWFPRDKKRRGNYRANQRAAQKRRNQRRASR